MKSRKVISGRNLPMRSPLIATLVWWLVLDHINAPGWAWGVFYTLLVIVWFAYAWDSWTNTSMNVFRD